MSCYAMFRYSSRDFRLYYYMIIKPEGFPDDGVLRCLLGDETDPAARAAIVIDCLTKHDRLIFAEIITFNHKNNNVRIYEALYFKHTNEIL